MKKIKISLIVSMITIAIVAVICWFINWRTVDEFCTALIYAAIIYLIVGGLSIIGSNRMRASAGYLYMNTMTEKPSNAVKDNNELMDKNLYFIIICACTAVILICLACLIKYI